ncbi:hypothetical protein DRN58_09650, partial [Thermococci archaeon]
KAWKTEDFEHAVIAFNDGILREDFVKLGINPFILNQKYWYDLRFLSRLFTIVKSLKPSLVHCRNAPSVVIYGGIATKIAGLPLVVSVHGHPDFFGDNFAVRLWYILQKQSDKIIAVSNDIKDALVRKGKIKPNRITVIHNGIDLTDVKFDTILRQKIKQKLGIDNTAQVIGCVGTLKLVKGHKYLIQAMPLILEKYPSTYLILVGDGPLRNDLKRLAEKLKVRERIMFLGYRPDIPKLMNIFDIFILPSLSEGLSNVLLEAMAASKPVIATNVGGNPEVVEDGETGLLVPPKDPQKIAEAVVSLLNDEDRRIRMGKAGLRRVKERFSISKTVREYEKVYHEVLHRR